MTRPGFFNKKTPKKVHPEKAVPSPDDFIRIFNQPGITYTCSSQLYLEQTRQLLINAELAFSSGRISPHSTLDLAPSSAHLPKTEFTRLVESVLARDNATLYAPCVFADVKEKSKGQQGICFSSSKYQTHKQEKPVMADHVITTKIGATRTITDEEIERDTERARQRLARQPLVITDEELALTDEVQRLLKHKPLVTDNEPQPACCTIQ